jgi:hypothetical protein
VNRLIFVAAGLLTLGGLSTGAEATEKRDGLSCGSYHGRRHLEHAVHRSFERRVGGRRQLGTDPATSTETVGHLVLIEGDRSIVSESNPFDLRAVSISFHPVQGSRYRVLRDSTQIRINIGDPVTLGDDDSREIELPFEFPFYDERHTRLFLNSDGNLTFESGDRASTPRSVSRFLTGPPRIAPFFDDLDPSSGGTVRVSSSPERLVITWETVPEWDETNENTFQVILENDGTVLMRYSNSIDADAAVVGLSPGGNPADIEFVDLSAGAFTANGALVEKFQQTRLIDNLALTRRFYQSFADRYDSIVVWTDFNSDLDGAFAFEITTQNDVMGIGDELFNDAPLWGSAGELESYVFMGNVNRYPSSPEARISGAGGRPTTLGLLAHEFGHRWLASVRFEDDGRRSDALLGRQQAHWSFFLDSDASFLEGNDIVEESESRFRTIEAVSRYSALDLYLMGLAPLGEVAPFFFVDDATGIGSTGLVDKESSPQTGVSLSGTKQQVLLDDILKVEGAREPSFETSPKEFRQAWILLYRSGARPSNDLIRQVESVRVAWEAFFRQMTLGRGAVLTTLEP